MKQIPKKLLDSLIYLYRNYWKTGDEEILPGIHCVALKIDEETKLSWTAINDFVNAVVKHRGLLPNADNETIYEALKVFGWEVVDEIQESESL